MTTFVDASANVTMRVSIYVSFFVTSWGYTCLCLGLFSQCLRLRSLLRVGGKRTVRPRLVCPSCERSLNLILAQAFSESALPSCPSL